MVWPSGEELGNSIPDRGNKSKAQRQGGLGGSGTPVAGAQWPGQCRAATKVKSQEIPCFGGLRMFLEMNTHRQSDHREHGLELQVSCMLSPHEEDGVL